MGRWTYEEVAGDRYIFDLSETQYAFGIPQGACKWAIQGEQDAAAMMACESHNADCDAYEAKIAELQDALETELQWLAEYQTQRDDAVERLARIAALVSLPGWADIVEAGGRLELVTQRLDAIRAILEEEG